MSHRTISPLTLRTTPPELNFFKNLFQGPPSPADVYKPDPTAKPVGLPRSYAEVHSAAISGVKAAIADGVPGVEVDFPLESLQSYANARGDGSPQMEERVNAANAEFVKKLQSAINSPSLVVGCNSGAVRALGNGAVSLREAQGALASDVVAICVSPSVDDQWDTVKALDARCVIVVNGCFEQGQLPHAYYYVPITSASKFAGGVVRCFPGAYECWNSNGKQLKDIEIPLQVQGCRALPDNKDAVKALRYEFGRPS